MGGRERNPFSKLPLMDGHACLNFRMGMRSPQVSRGVSYNFVLIDISEFVLKLSREVYMGLGSSQLEYQVPFHRVEVSFLLWFPSTVNMILLAEEGNSHNLKNIPSL